MGEVRDEVKGAAPKRKKRTEDPAAPNLIQTVDALRDEISELIEIKERETQEEGDAARPENERKVAVLRATYALITTAKTLLEDY